MKFVVQRPFQKAKANSRNVCEAAARALVRLDDGRVISPLVGLLEDPGKRPYAIQVLRGMGEEGIQALVRAYGVTKDRAARNEIGEALGDRKPKRGVFG